MLSDFFSPRLTELGKVKIGGLGQERTSAKGSTYRQPEKHDYFTITTMNRTPKGDLAPDMELMNQLLQTHGSGEPRALRQLPIRLLSDDIEDVMQSAYLWYGGKTLAARGDGKAVTWFNDPATGRRLAEPKTEPWDDALLDLRMPDTSRGPGAKLFKLHTTFNCVIAAKEARWGGVYKFRTTSIISGSQLYGSLVETLRLTCGVLVGMPLMLVVRPKMVAPDGKPTTIYVVHVELRGAEMRAIQDQALTQMRYAVEFKSEMEASKAQYRKMLAAPGEHESADDAGDINQEFQPETVGETVEKAPPATEDPLLAGATDTSTPKREPEHPTPDTAAAPAEPDEAPLTAEEELGPAAARPSDAPTDPPAPGGVALIGPVEKQKIMAARKALGMTAQEWTVFLAQFGVTSGVNLSCADGTTACRQLEAMMKEKKIRPPAVVNDAPPPAQKATPPAAGKPIQPRCPGCGSVDTVMGRTKDYLCRACGNEFDDAIPY